MEGLRCGSGCVLGGRRGAGLLSVDGWWQVAKRRPGAGAGPMVGYLALVSNGLGGHRIR